MQLLKRLLIQHSSTFSLEMVENSKGGEEMDSIET